MAVAVGTIDLEDDTYRGDIWVLDTEGAADPVCYTHGYRDSEPSWSPDGRWLAFLRAQPGAPGPAGRPQLHLMRAHGGEPVPLTAHPLGVSGPAWAPDGRTIAYLARVPEPGRYGTDPAVRPEHEPPRRITTLSYKRDLVGYKIDQRRHVFAIGVPDSIDGGRPAPRQLTDGDFDHSSIGWSPEGEAIVVVSARHDDRDVRLTQDAFTIDVSSGDLHQVTDTSLVVSRPRFSGDGETVYFLGYEPGASGRDVFGFSSAMWAVPRDGSAPPRPVTKGLALPSDRSPDLPSEGTLIPMDGAVLVEQEHRGAIRLLRIGEAGDHEVLIDGDRQVLGFDAVGDTIAATIGTDTSAGEVVVVRGSDERTLTHFGAPLEQGAELLGSRKITAMAADGYELEAFLVEPAGAGPHPLIVFIYGGPFVMAGWQLLDEAQIYAGAGYAVLLTNERGRAGYGEDHGRAVMGDMAGIGSRDILTLLDAALETGKFDPDRVGVMGGSYGGFMTSWLVTQTDRFRTAISERAINDWDRSGDIGYYYPDYYIGTSVEKRRASSPITYADAIKTPMLLIQSEADCDTPLVQAERLFFELKLRGAEVELLVFPGEGHDLTRSGLPSHRVTRFEAVVEWFDRWLREP